MSSPRSPQAHGMLKTSSTMTASFQAPSPFASPSATIATAVLMRPVAVLAPEGSIVNARPPAAVVGGNVETSQRIVDTLLLALSQTGAPVPAASQGTMNNLTIGGTDHRTNRPFAYYETVAGGMGARPEANGIDGVHTHMTN